MAPNTEEGVADIAAAIIASEAAASDWVAHFELGLAYLRHNMFAEAVPPFERARELDGTRIATHLNLSAALTNSGDGRGGEAAARAAIALDPASGGYFCLGNALRKQRQPEAAADMFRKHLELEPLDFDARCNLGLALGDAGHHQDALAEFQAVLRVQPRDPRALDGAGVALRRLGDYEGAISMSRRSCEVDPTDPQAWFALGFCLARAGSHVEALAAFERLLVIAPNHVKGHSNMVATLINLERASDALEHAEHALTLGSEHSNLAVLIEIAKPLAMAQQAVQNRPSDPTAYFELGVAYLKHGPVAHSVPALERARELGPDRAETLLALSSAYVKTGRGSLGEAAAREAMALDPVLDGDRYLADALRSEGRLEAAIAHYRRHLKRSRDDLDARCDLGYALKDAGLPREALAELEAVISKRPEHFMALGGAAVLHGGAGDYKRAIDLLHRACRVDPTSTWAWETLGYYLMGAERFPESVVAHKRLVALDEGHFHGNLNLGKTFYNLGQNVEAFPYAERASQIKPDSDEAREFLELIRSTLAEEKP